MLFRSVLYSIGPSPGALEPTIDNYLHHNTGQAIKLASSNSDISLIDAATQEGFFGGPNGTSCVVKARTVITETQGTAIVPIVEQTTTSTLTINRESRPTLNPNGFLIKVQNQTTFPIAITAPAGKTVKYDISVPPAQPDGDVTEGDSTATFGSGVYTANRVITANTYDDFVFRVRVFQAATVPSQLLTVPYYWKRNGPAINLPPGAVASHLGFTPVQQGTGTGQLNKRFGPVNSG